MPRGADWDFLRAHPGGSIFEPFFVFITLCTLCSGAMVIIGRGSTAQPLIATLFELIMSTPLALSDGCKTHGEDVVMSCMAGQTWNAETQQCVDVNE